MINICIFLIFITTCFARPIKVIAYDGKSKVHLVEISTDQYIKSLLALNEGLEGQVEKEEIRLPLNAQGWKLQKFSLGLGTSGEIGIGPFSFASSLKQRFIYSRSL